MVFTFIPQQKHLITHLLLRAGTVYCKILIENLVSGFLKVKIFQTLIRADEVNVR